MLFDQMTKDMMTMETEFLQMESMEEILSAIKEKTLDKLEEQTAFMKEYPNPIYSVMRMDYLMESENMNHQKMVIDLYKENKLVDHLMETQTRAIAFMKEEKPKMMKAWNIETKDNPQYQTMISALKEVVIKEVVEN